MLATGKLANAKKIRTSVSHEPALAFVLFIVLLRPFMSDKRSQANFQIFPFLEGRCLQRLEASQTPLVSCPRNSRYQLFRGQDTRSRERLRSTPDRASEVFFRSW